MSVGVMVELKVEDIANSIKKMKRADKEMLLFLLSGKDREIARRVRDIKTKKVKPLTREETFKDVL
jgi:hypothetical protein